MRETEKNPAMQELKKDRRQELAEEITGLEEKRSATAKITEALEK